MEEKKLRRRVAKFFNLSSIKMSMIFFFVLLISIVVLFLSLSAYYYTVADLEDVSINYTVRLLKEVNANIDAYIDNMKSMGRVVVENKDVRQLMSFYRRHKGDRLTEAEEHQLLILEANASTHMNIVANTRKEIANIAIISKYGDVVLSSPLKTVNPYAEYEKNDWYLKPLTQKNDIVVSPSHVQNLIKGEYRWVISISQAITDGETGEVTGVMLIDLSYKSIEDICENAQLGANGYIYLLDDMQNIIYHPQQQLIYSGVKTELVDPVLNLQEQEGFIRDGNNKLYMKNRSALTGWSAVGVVNTDELVRNRAGTIRFYVVLAVVAILFSTVLAVLISTSITRPVKKLENTMHRVENGDFNVQAEVELDNEIGHLAKTFNSMIARIKKLMRDAVANEEEKRKSEIKALEAQINPHFLYNTLDTIIWMSAGGKNDEVVEVTSALAKLFRTSISKGSNLVPLSVELENIQSYLTIQKMRYKDKLTYRIEVPEKAQNLLTPKLILQPIVENAVYHGIKMSRTGGEIVISVHPGTSLLTISVTDSGVGMTEEQIAHIFEPKQETDRGIGVLNVHNRIKLCFGGEYGLRFTSGEGKGTRVDICLPIIEREEQLYDETSLPGTAGGAGGMLHHSGSDFPL